MTTAAREVLEDCRGALAELVDGITGPVWRRRWIISVVLLRAVGHVLDKVDGACSQQYRTTIDEWWKQLKNTRPNPEIFWLFIHDERNSIVKEYQTNAGQGVTVTISGIVLNIQTGEQTVGVPIPPKYHYTMNAGYFKDREQRELICEAIQWWETQLKAIDATVEQILCDIQCDRVSSPSST